MGKWTQWGGILQVRISYMFDDTIGSVCLFQRSWIQTQPNEFPTNEMCLQNFKKQMYLPMFNNCYSLPFLFTNKFSGVITVNGTNCYTISTRHQLELRVMELLLYNSKSKHVLPVQTHTDRTLFVVG